MWKDSVHVIIIEGVQSGWERGREWEREREQERVRESVPNKGKQSAPLRTIVTSIIMIFCLSPSHPLTLHPPPSHLTPHTPHPSPPLTSHLSPPEPSPLTLTSSPLTSSHPQNPPLSPLSPSHPLTLSPDTPSHLSPLTSHLAPTQLPQPIPNSWPPFPHTHSSISPHSLPQLLHTHSSVPSFPQEDHGRGAIACKGNGCP